MHADNDSRCKFNPNVEGMSFNVVLNGVWRSVLLGSRPSWVPEVCRKRECAVWWCCLWWMSVETGSSLGSSSWQNEAMWSPTTVGTFILSIGQGTASRNDWKTSRIPESRVFVYDSHPHPLPLPHPLCDGAVAVGRRWDAIDSSGATPKRTTAESARAMDPPAGWSEGRPCRTSRRTNVGTPWHPWVVEAHWLHTSHIHSSPPMLHFWHLFRLPGPPLCRCPQPVVWSTATLLLFSWPSAALCEHRPLCMPSGLGCSQTELSCEHSRANGLFFSMRFHHKS